MDLNRLPEQVMFDEWPTRVGTPIETNNKNLYDLPAEKMGRWDKKTFEKNWQTYEKYGESEEARAGHCAAIEQ